MQRSGCRDHQRWKARQRLAAATFRSAGRLRKVSVTETAGEMGLERRIGPLRFYVLFLAPGSKEIDEAKKLVDAMQNQRVDDRVLALQTGKLKELIGRLAADKSANQGPASEPEIGGVFRGAAFPWRQFARAANFAPDRPGVVIISSEGAEKK